MKDWVRIDRAGVQNVLVNSEVALYTISPPSITFAENKPTVEVASKKIVLSIITPEDITSHLISTP